MTAEQPPRRARRLPTAVRLAAVQWGIVSLSAILVFGAITRATERLLETEAQAHLETELQGLAELHALGGLQAVAAAIGARLADPEAAGRIYLLLSPDGTPLAGNLARWPQDLAADGRVPPERLLAVDRTDLGHATRSTAQAMRLADGARLMVGRDGAVAARAREALGLALLTGIGAATLVAAGTGWLLARLLVARMLAIRETATAILEGDLARRIPADPQGDEFDLLARTLNLMLARLESQLRALSFASTGIAHDLRAPLTRLRLALECLATPDGDGRAAAALAELDRVQRILSTLLAIARTRAGLGRAQMAPIDLTEIAADIVELHEPQARLRGVRLALDPGPATRAKGHRDLLFVALSNLVENALTAVSPGGRVTVSVTRTRASAILEVVDDGPGLPAATRQRLADLASGAGAASSGSGEAGLGLALVMAVAAMHDGELTLTDRDPGLVARLVLPI
ncbi:MAG: ATP-binding protein [Pikeienuella sp.]